MSEERGRWYLLTGLVIGAVLGLVYAWLVSPREYSDTSPASLQTDFKDQYRAMIALAYVSDGNLPRARARLELLGDEDAIRSLAEQAQRTLAEGRSPREAQALGLLAVSLGQGPVPLPSLPPVNLTLPASPSLPHGFSESIRPVDSGGFTQPERYPHGPDPGHHAHSFSTGTPLPTRTQTPTPGAPFILGENTFVCDQSLGGPLLQVQAQDAAGGPLAGVEVIVSWEGGEDHFFTGLKPDMGPGYADFTMTPGVVYTLRLADGGEPVEDLTAAECEAEGGSRYWGSWLLVFSQP
jgi:hypothetical protein